MNCNQAFINHNAFLAENINYIPFKDLNHEYLNIPTHIPVILSDSTGVKSRNAYLNLTKHNFTNLAILSGGFVEWERDNLPIVTDLKNRLTGSCMCQLKQRTKKTNNK